MLEEAFESSVTFSSIADAIGTLRESERGVDSPVGLYIDPAECVPKS